MIHISCHLVPIPMTVTVLLTISKFRMNQNFKDLLQEKGWEVMSEVKNFLKKSHLLSAVLSFRIKPISSPVEVIFMRGH